MSSPTPSDIDRKEDRDAKILDTEADIGSVESVELPQGRQLGLVSAVFLMVNRMVGTGVFATTSTILSQSGSVGMSLL